MGVARVQGEPFGQIGAPVQELDQFGLGSAQPELDRPLLPGYEGPLNLSSSTRG
jgi:hypothetical protein